MLIFATSAYSDPEPIQSFVRIAAYGRRHRLTTDVHAADAILFVENSRYHEDAFYSRLRQHALVRRYRERCFMYNEHACPWSLLPGVYCSMPKRWFDRKRQRATRYIRLVNPVDTAPSDQPDILFSFVGNTNIPLRTDLMRLHGPRAILEDTSGFDAFFNKSECPNHLRYADILRRSKFVLCPRGSGTSSFRLYETLRAGRVPVIISDQWMEPEGPDWSRCSLRVRERNIGRIPELVAKCEARWPEMALAARQVWSQWLADDVLFDHIGDSLASLARDRSIPESIAQRVPSASAWEWRIRRSVYFLRAHMPSSRGLRTGTTPVARSK
jgi:hypothetical protein